MREKILEILKKHNRNIQDRSVFFYPDIPEKKLINAIQKYAPSVDKNDVLVLIDDTVFGRATEGALLTSDHFYTNEAFEGVKKYELRQMSAVSFVDGVLGCALHINDSKAISTTQPSKSAMRFFSEMLREIYESLKGDIEEDDGQLRVKKSLVNLKSIFEMGLISQEEYDETRKKYISQL